LLNNVNIWFVRKIGIFLLSPRKCLFYAIHYNLFPLRLSSFAGTVSHHLWRIKKSLSSNKTKTKTSKLVLFIDGFRTKSKYSTLFHNVLGFFTCDLRSLDSTCYFGYRKDKLCWRHLDAVWTKTLEIKFSHLHKLMKSSFYHNF